MFQFLNSNTLVVELKSLDNVQVIYEYIQQGNYKVKSHIKEVTINDLVHRLGDTIQIELSIRKNNSNSYKVSYNIGKIEIRDFGNGYNILIYQEIPNDSTIYLLPLLSNKDFSTKEDFSTNQLVNTYLLGKDKLVLKYRYNTLFSYELMINKINTHKHLIEKIKSSDKHYDCFIFQIPSTINNIRTLETFTQSQWHQFSDKYKNKLVKFNKLEKQSITYNVIYNSDIYRKQLENDLGCRIPKSVPLKSKIKDEWILREEL